MKCFVMDQRKICLSVIVWLVMTADIEKIAVSSVEVKNVYMVSDYHLFHTSHSVPSW